jgi:hypothetical protein
VRCGEAIDLATRLAWCGTARKKRDVKPSEWAADSSVRFRFDGGMFIVMGALPLLRGKTYYENNWGGPVFAPFAIFIALLFLVGVFTPWRKGINFSRE